MVDDQRRRLCVLKSSFEGIEHQLSEDCWRVAVLSHHLMELSSRQSIDVTSNSVGNIVDKDTYV